MKKAVKAGIIGAGALVYSIIPTYLMKYYWIIRDKKMAKKEEKVLYLTFDDGPDTVYTNKLLDLLDQEQVPATFFMVAEAAQGHPDIVKRMKKSGYSIGADEVVYPEKQLAKWAAIRYSSEHILDYIELQDDHAIMEVTIPPEWMDRTIGEINIRKKYNINILALKKDGKLDMSITPDTQLCRDESMLVLGKYASIQKCFRL